MDFILDRINSEIEICKPDSYDYVTYLRCRIEYMLFFLMGYLWNRNQDVLLPERKHEIVSKLCKPTIGTVILAIRKLDINNEIIPRRGKAINKILDEYTNVRNMEIGHGYAPSDEIVPKLQPFYNDLLNCIPLLKKEFCIVVVEERENENYHGLRMDWDKNGRKESWACPVESLPSQEYFPRTYIYDGKSYEMISPFVTLLNRGNDIYVFNDLVDFLSGNVKLCPLFGKAPINYAFQELSRLCVEDDSRKISMTNQTIINNFDQNYLAYHEVGITNIILKFLKENRSSVTATIWGHGGVGKTACIQNVCDKLFCSSEKLFSYIVFVTAKDRVYNPYKGIIEDNHSTFVRKYYEVISVIAQTIFNQYDDLAQNSELLNEAEQKISDLKDRVLIIIDDYETFEDEEKEKIISFVRTLDINFHKVIFTTRNKQFAVGETIAINELNREQTKEFAMSVISERYLKHKNKLEVFLNDESALNMLSDSTSGRPIFIYQFVHLFVQAGCRQDLLSNLSKGEAAQDFLYGRIYSSLSNDAKYVFVVLPQISNTEMMFRIDILKYLLEKELTSEQFDQAFIELIDLRIVEQTGDSRGRIYAPELLEIANESFKTHTDKFRSTIRNQLALIGGKDINGTIQEAMLMEADQSRINGNTTDTISKYRHILNQTNFPMITRRRALFNAANYLASSTMNPKGASDLMLEYLGDFKDDAEVCRRYVEYLWQQQDDDDGRNEAKAQADSFIRQYFSGPRGHKKYTEENYLFFTIGVTYCTYYDLHYRKFESKDARRRHYSTTINEYGGELFRHISSESFKKLKSTIKHFAQVALIQTIKMSIELGKDDSAKLDTAIKIHNFGVNNFSDAFMSQLHSLKSKILKIAPSKEAQLIPSLQNRVKWNLFMSTHSLGDDVECTIIQISEDSVQVMVENSVKGVFWLKKNSTNRYDIGQKIVLRIKYFSNQSNKLGLELRPNDDSN